METKHAMTKEELKQRLIELLNIVPCKEGCCSAMHGGRCIDLDDLDRCQIESIVNNLIANGVTIRKNACWKTREDKNDYLWVECSNCGFVVENYKAVKLGCSSTDVIGYKYHSCPICTAKMVLPVKEGV